MKLVCVLSISDICKWYTANIVLQTEIKTLGSTYITLSYNQCT